MDISLYTTYREAVLSIPRELNGVEECNSLVRAAGDLEEVLYVAQLQLTLIKQTAVHLGKRNLTCFDPIVGENTCQWRAIHIIESSQDRELLSEAKRIEGEARSKLQKINHLRSKPLALKATESRESLLEQLDLDIKISQRMEYCALSYFLTCGKYFQMYPCGKEVSGISLHQIRVHLCKHAPIELLEKLERRSRERIAALTIPLIQSKALELDGALSIALSDRYIRRIVTRSRLELQTSVAVHNFKTVFLTLMRMQIPIVVTEHRIDKKPSSIHLAYRSENGLDLPTRIAMGQIDSEDPIFEMEIFPNKEKSIEELDRAIREVGIIDLALANMAALPQYSEDDDISQLPKEAQEEILRYRAMGEALDCLAPRQPKIFRIAHTHATTKREIKI